MSETVWHPTKEYIESTRLYQWMNKLGYSDYDTFFNKTVEDVAWFWHEAEKELEIPWYEPYTKSLNDANGIEWPIWFEEGTLNASHLSIGKWAEDPSMKDKKALVWEGEDGAVRTFTYIEMQEEVDRVAGGFRKLGLKKGDVVGIYMPMLPETVIAMMAASKIGAVFAPVFSGYGAEAVATRLNAGEAKALITADGFLRRGKTVMMKEEADRAADLSPTVEKVIVISRLNADTTWNDERDVDWQEMRNSEKYEQTERMDSQEPLMLLYTSGTTGKPKGAVHTHSGFPIKAAFDAGIGMDVKREDVLFWYTDMGWMMGPFLVYGGLVNGATILLYEGTPDYPNPDRIWELVAKHNVSHLGISPTLIRSLMTQGDEWVNKHSLDTLRVVGSTGEPWNPEPWMWLFQNVGKKQIPIFNYSGGTEIAGGILGNVLVRPIGPITFNSPLPGMAADVFDPTGKPVENEVGELVIKKPWVGMTKGFWGDSERYLNTYWSRFEQTWVHGDWVIKDTEGQWTITGRSDDILNVAGKRLGPAEVESVLVGHEAVKEAGTIGIPDEVKGEAAICFAVLNQSKEPSEALKKELLSLVAEKLGKALKPKNLYFVSDLPKTRNAKVMRRAIKAAYLGLETGDLSALENPQVLREIEQVKENVNL
ncbi:AMP-dependent synthetase [Alkalihalophilus pseudofirmus]|uniref:acetate--CoA ligase n=1 Tax=Alkalihalophilus pseudofirmus TaxID=79885 RepID=A0AAJ2NQP8_ALKPS|nr:AMP-binding protein [Alkalihalophilus pseudofirmus]MDV2886864.1 AMP-binding protein [Alkalihalophilus pseudofirmus]OLS36660.1 AMP-dependent synthetase [Alkalihalophilus pseudofirmus]